MLEKSIFAATVAEIFEINYYYFLNRSIFSQIDSAAKNISKRFHSVDTNTYRKRRKKCEQMRAKTENSESSEQELGHFCCRCN